jgi:hypothetical protein
LDEIGIGSLRVYPSGAEEKEAEANTQQGPSDHQNARYFFHCLNGTAGLLLYFLRSGMDGYAGKSKKNAVTSEGITAQIPTRQIYLARKPLARASLMAAEMPFLSMVRIPEVDTFSTIHLFSSGMKNFLF